MSAVGCGPQENNTKILSDEATQAGSSSIFSDRNYEVGYDENESAIITLNGASTVFASRENVVSLVEEVTSIVLDS